MPVTVGFSAAVGAALGQAKLIGTLTALQGALLYGGIAAANFVVGRLFAPDAPKLAPAARTQNLVQGGDEPARWPIGQTRISGWMPWASENTAEVTGVTRPDGQNNRTKIEKFEYFSFVMVLSELPLESIDGYWVNGVWQPIRYGTTLTGPNDTIRVLEDQTAFNAYSPIIPPLAGDWGIGLGDGGAGGQNDYDFPETDGESDRLSGTTRNLEWQRWPYIIWPRITGYGKPPFAQERAEGGWWDKNKADEQKGKPGHAYVVVDCYQNTGDDEDVRENLGFNWRGIPQIEFLVKGIRIKPPVILPDGTIEEGVESWTDNPNLISYWFMRNRMGFPNGAIDVRRTLAGATECEEMIPDNAYEDEPEDRGFSPTREITRYGADGLITAGDSAIEVLRGLAQAVDGNVVRSDGRLFLRPGQFEAVPQIVDPGPDEPQTGEFRAPVTHLTSDMVYRFHGDELQPPTSGRANRAHLKLARSALHGWIPWDMTEVVNRAGERFDGYSLPVDMKTAPFIVQPTRARLLMEAELLRLRVEAGDRMAPIYTVTFLPGDRFENFRIKASDRITWSYDTEGIDRLESEVLRVRVNSDWTLTMVLRANGSLKGLGRGTVQCPGFGDRPPSWPAFPIGHVASLYLAPSTLLYTTREASQTSGGSS